MTNEVGVIDPISAEADEREVAKIEKEIDKTKAALSEKIATLENQVIGTISETTNAVAETVNTMQESVAAVKETVSDTIENVSEEVASALDIRAHVRNDPWMAIGVSVAAGFATGLYINHMNRPNFDSLASHGEPKGYGSGYQDEPSSFAGSPRPVRPAGPSMMSKLMEMAGPQLMGLKQMAISTALGMAYDAARKHVPPEWEGKVRETFDDIHRSLVGN